MRASRGLKWENKMYKLKGSIPRATQETKERINWTAPVKHEENSVLILKCF